jgi:catechol 2,3-dioxygenase-like lactoylglutathione lyase family enzyme
MSFDTHGRIKCGTVNTPRFDPSLDDYTGRLSFRVVEQGIVSPEQASLWGAPASAGKRTALLTSASESDGYLRLVEGTVVPDYRPLRSYGWASFEITCQDVFALHDRIAGNGFDVVGPPKLVPGFDTFIPFQVSGRAGEVLYLNEVLKPHAGSVGLPTAAAPVDFTFIVILAAKDRAAAVKWHVDALGFEEAETYVIPYSVINQSFGLPDDFQTAMTMTKVGELAGTEVDQYPDGTTERPVAPGELPPGNALVTFIVRDLDAVCAPFVAPPAILDGPMYGGRRAACVRGASGEWIELIEERSR